MHIVDIFGIVWGSSIDLESMSEGLVNLHYRCLVVHLVAVVWCRPHCHQILVKRPFVALLDQLMSPNYHPYFVHLLKFLHHLATEEPTRHS